MEFLIVLVVFGVIFGALGSWIAKERHRDQGEGFVLGFLFGPLGVIVEAILPTVAMAPAAPQPPPLSAEELARIRITAQKHEQEQKAANERLWQERMERDRKHEEQLAIQRQLEAQKHQENRQRKEAQQLLARRRRREFIDSVPEGTKVIVGVIGGVIAIVMFFVCILALVPKS